MWYSCTTLALELKIEVLYKRDDGVMNTFGSVVGGKGCIYINLYIFLQKYKINTKNHLTRYFLGCIIIGMIGGYQGRFLKHIQSNSKQFKGSKVYSESACVFLPKEINLALSTKKSQRGDCLIGVRKTKTGYQSRCNIRGKNYSLGTFNTEIEAFNAYKQTKENYLKELATKWKDKIDTRAYNALMEYQVEITD